MYVISSDDVDDDEDDNTYIHALQFHSGAADGAGGGHTRRPSLTDPVPSADFEAGLLFER